MQGVWNWWQGILTLGVLLLFAPAAGQARPPSAPDSAEALRATSLRNYLSIQPDGLGLDVVDGPALNQILISLPKGQADNISVHFTPSPARLTVDMPDWNGKKELQVSGINTSFVSGLKVSPSRNGARMVVSLSSGRKLEYQTNRGASRASSDLVVISLAPVGKLKTIMSSLPSGYRRPILAPPVEMKASISQKEQLERSASETSDKTVQSSPAGQEEQKTPSRTALAVTSLKLPVFTNGENALVIETDAEIARSPELQALGNSVYALRFRDTRLGPKASLTSLFPAGTGTLGSVRSLQQGTDAVIKIFCAAENPLKLRVSGKSAVVGTQEILSVYSFEN